MPYKAAIDSSMNHSHSMQIPSRERRTFATIARLQIHASA